MRQIRIEGIVIGKKAYGEGHELVFVFSKELGKIKTQAKGSRKIKSKFLGHLETLNICDLQVYKGPHSLLITECNTLQTFNFDNLSTEHTEYAVKIAHALFRNLAEEESDNLLYFKIKKYLIDFTKNETPFLTYLQVCTEIIKHLGFFNNFSNNCPSCLNEIHEDTPSYLINNETIVCKDCTNNNQITLSIPSRYRKFLTYLTDMPHEHKGKLKIHSEEQMYLEKLLDSFFKAPHQ